MRRSGAAACAIPTLRFGESVEVDANRSPELGERFRVATDALDGDHLPVANREDRLHIQQVPRERGRAADAAPACEVLERVDREEEVVIVLVMRDELIDLLVGGAALEPPLHAEPEHRDRRGSRS